MSKEDKRDLRLNKPAKMTMAGLTAVGIGVGIIFDLFLAGFFIGLGMALITAARLLKSKGVE